MRQAARSENENVAVLRSRPSTYLIRVGTAYVKSFLSGLTSVRGRRSHLQRLQQLRCNSLSAAGDRRMGRVGRVGRVGSVAASAPGQRAGQPDRDVGPVNGRSHQRGARNCAHTARLDRLETQMKMLLSVVANVVDLPRGV